MLAFILPTVKPPMSKPLADESALINGLTAGNTSAIKTLYDQYSGSLNGIITRIIANEEIAQDILQDTFVKIWRSITTYDPQKGRLFTWMANIARNLAIDHIRSKTHRNNCQNDDIEENHHKVERAFNFSINPDLLDIKKFVNTLRTDQKALINLIYFQGYTQSEAAEELNIPLGTVKTRVRISILALRKFYS